jgi:hypothetical protein
MDSHSESIKALSKEIKDNWATLKKTKVALKKDQKKS